MERLLPKETTSGSTTRVLLDCASVVRIAGTLDDLVVCTDRTCIRVSGNRDIEVSEVKPADGLSGVEVRSARKAVEGTSGGAAGPHVSSAMTLLARNWAEGPNAGDAEFPIPVLPNVPQHGASGGSRLWSGSQISPARSYSWRVLCSTLFLKKAMDVQPYSYGHILGAMADLAHDPLDLAATVPSYAVGGCYYPEIRPVTVPGMSLWRCDAAGARLIYHVDRDRHLVNLLTIVPLG